MAASRLTDLDWLDLAGDDMMNLRKMQVRDWEDLILSQSVVSRTWMQFHS